MTNFEILDDLVAYLEKTLAAPQKSERWSMYRAILPIVDFAISETNIVAFFEYNQTSRHNTPQSVDIALLDSDEKPILLIEAKRYERAINSDEVTKYLIGCSRGIVSNGVDWCLRADGYSGRVSILADRGGQVEVSSLTAVIEFIQGAMPIFSGGQIADFATRPKAYKPVKSVKAVRNSKPVRLISRPHEVTEYLASVMGLSDNDRLFVGTLCALIGNFAPNLRCEVRPTRMVIFHESTRERLFRIEFGKRESSVILRTDLVETRLELSVRAASDPHNKHPGFREFRPSSQDQVVQLARSFATILSSCNYVD